jgi:hypothetical protein
MKLLDFFVKLLSTLSSKSTPPMSTNTSRPETGYEEKNRRPRVDLKSGVDTRGIVPQLLLALMVAKSVYDKRDAEFTITSLCDGLHKRQSAHYSGRAADIRIWTLVSDFDWSQIKMTEASVIAVSIASEISSLLGEDFDCIAEKDHIHLEWDPKVG